MWYQPDMWGAEGCWRFSSILWSMIQSIVPMQRDHDKNYGHLWLGWASWLVIHIGVLGGWGPEGNGSFALGPTQLWSYMSLHLPDPDLYLLHITVTINIALFWVLWVLLGNSWTWGGSGNPWLCSQLVRSAAGLRTPELVAWVWSERSPVEDCALYLWNLTNLG